MQLPPALRQAVAQELAACDGGRLRAASARLTECYREGGAGSTASRDASTGALGGALSNEEQRAAYLAVRLPATFAAVVAALRWTREACGDDVRTVLDLGSGPGTALWAATEVFPTLDSATSFECDSKMIEIARRIAADAEHSALREATWLQGDLTAALPEGTWDLVLCSYALNELREAQRAEFTRKAWARTKRLLIVIEPGTKAGFANIIAVRTRLLAEGAILAAPCPNSLDCPMAGGNDWCHFAARVERTAEHRRLKNATLGHEDEKFSYVAFSRNEVQRPNARIVRHPKVFSGYTQLTLCREGAVENTKITRSKKDDWRRLKRLGWGDAW
jgi:ribosomal protein RSM22 (predicted rRNA methylase)